MSYGTDEIRQVQLTDQRTIVRVNVGELEPPSYGVCAWTHTL
jgi:hypothetical protein